MEKINSLGFYLKKYKIIENDDYTDKECINILLNEIKDKHSILNNTIKTLLIDNKTNELDELGKVLIRNNIKFKFNMQKPSINNLEILKVYLKYSDENTCSNKGNIIKALVKAEDLEGIDILLKSNFINSRNVNKYLNFAINSGKYQVVPKLIERKNI